LSEVLAVLERMTPQRVGFESQALVAVLAVEHSVGLGLSEEILELLEAQVLQLVQLVLVLAEARLLAQDYLAGESNLLEARVPYHLVLVQALVSRFLEVLELHLGFHLLGLEQVTGYLELLADSGLLVVQEPGFLEREVSDCLELLEALGFLALDFLVVEVLEFLELVESLKLRVYAKMQPLEVVQLEQALTWQ